MIKNDALNWWDKLSAVNLENPSDSMSGYTKRYFPFKTSCWDLNDDEILLIYQQVKKISGKFNSVDDLSILEIINQDEILKEAMRFIIENNKSNDAPYHNLTHGLCVTKNVYEGLRYHYLLGDTDKVRDMLLAAMFHDFNHTQGKEKDDVNISKAKGGVIDFVMVNEEIIIKNNVTINKSFIYELIDATQYPYIIEFKDLNKYQAIIRDADLMQVFEYNWIQQIILGLSTELNMSFTDFIGPQKKFLEMVEFNSPWGQLKKEAKFKQVMKEFTILENIMK